MLKDIVNLTGEPAVTSPMVRSRFDEVAAAERGYAEVLAGVLGVEQVAGGSHFFDDLDADSMVMARFCARVRKRDDLPTVSMKDIYRHPTITGLAVAFGRPAPPDGAGADAGRPVEFAAPSVSVDPVGEIAEGSTSRYLLCGALQALLTLAYAYLTAAVLDWGFVRLNEAADAGTFYVRAVEVGSATLLGMCLLPVVAKWVLIGRWKPGTIRVWSLAYVRFWCVKVLMRANPLVLFAGSPIYTLYLRMMGAKVGKRVTVYSPTTVCTDLLTIGDDTVIRKDAQLPGYRAVSGVIEIGPITIGGDVIVGEQTVIDIKCSMADGSRLGHSCSLHAGQHIPAGEFWQGSPARPTESTFPDIDPARCGAVRRLLYPLCQLIIPLGIYAPLLLGAPVLVARIPQLAPLLNSGPGMLAHWTYYRDVALCTLAIAVGFAALNFLFIMTVPRLLNLGLKPGRVYPLFGFHYWLQRTITRRTNSGFFMELVGDSSYVVHYLRALGYDLGRYEQTGSNFGAGVKHDNPYLSSVGPGTMVADGLSMINIDYSSSSFRLARTSVGERSFLGNAIAYPPQARAGRNCLLGTMTMVPIDGPARADMGLLGAPSFEIPRTVERDSRLEVTDHNERRRRLRAKNRHNTATIVMFLVARWIPVYLTVLVGEAADLNASLGAPALLALSVASSAVGLTFLIALQRSVNRLTAVRPEGCSIYDRAFWRHERYWKLPVQTWMQAFNGTPFKNLIWRALGVHIGRRVFDDGLVMPEKSLVTIGDDCTLNAGSVVQCHSQEDGAFKSDRTTLGAGVTLGVGAFVHYGVTIGDGAVLAPGTFVMKGEELPSQTRWIGNPAALAITTSSAYPPAPAALRADSAPVTAALAARPHAVVEWNGQGWSFPGVDHYADVVEGPVTRLRVDRPGMLRLTGSGEGLRIELIPDDRDSSGPTPIGLPLPSQVLAITGSAEPHGSARGWGVSRPYAAGLVLIALIGGLATLLRVNHIVPTSALVPNTTCVSGAVGCPRAPTPHPPPSTTADAVAGGADRGAPESASALHRPAPPARRPIPVIHRPVPATRSPASTVSTARSGQAMPNTIGSGLSDPTLLPDSATYSDGTSETDGTTTSSKKKKAKKVKTTDTPTAD